MGEHDDQSTLRTLFISGLPDDIKEREIYNLFRTFPGYESCQLKYSGRGFQIIAFAVFSDHSSALKAKEALNGLNFDPSLRSSLHIELARANSRAKRARTENGDVSSFDKKPRVPVGVAGLMADNGVGATVHMPGLVHSVYNDMSGFPSPQSGGMVGGSFAIQDSLSGMMMLQGPNIRPPLPTRGSNAPCSTLFVANLGPTCTEAELFQVLAGFPGFLKLKMQIRGGLPVAFVDFQDEVCSTQTLIQLQNMLLPSSDRGGMRLEYAKSRMGHSKSDSQ